jgi:dsRNA-specific ribonuclease
VLVEETGPEHSKTFTVEARLQSREMRNPEFVGRAQGSTKKTAEQDAARQLLTYLASRPKETEVKAIRSPQAVDK